MGFEKMYKIRQKKCLKFDKKGLKFDNSAIN